MSTSKTNPRIKQPLEFLVFGFLGFNFLILGYFLDYFTFLGLLFLGYSLLVQSTNQIKIIQVDEEHKQIILSDDFRITQIPLSEVRSLIQLPFRDRIILCRKRNSSIILPRNFSNLQLFKKLGLISHIYKNNGNRILLRVSRFNLLAYILLLAIQVAVVVFIFLSVPDVLIGLLPMLILIPTLLSTLKRFLLNPISYVLSDKELIVKTLLGKKHYQNHELTHARFDRYFFEGAPYFVCRFHFGKQVYVLDEYYLNTPIYLHRRWIHHSWIDKKVK